MVIHDFCYRDQSRGRKESDDILLEAMIVLEVGRFKRTLIHWAVRIFGGLAWWGAKRAKKRGEVRVVDTPPEKSVETRQDVMKRALEPTLEN